MPEKHSHKTFSVGPNDTNAARNWNRNWDDTFEAAEAPPKNPPVLPKEVFGGHTWGSTDDGTTVFCKKCGTWDPADRTESCPKNPDRYWPSNLSDEELRSTLEMSDSLPKSDIQKLLDEYNYRGLQPAL